MFIVVVAVVELTYPIVPRASSIKPTENAAVATVAESSQNAVTAAAVPGAEAAAAVPDAATAVQVDEEKIKMALHLIQQMDPGKPVDPVEENRLRQLEVGT